MDKSTESMDRVPRESLVGTTKYAPPTTPSQLKLTKIWADALRLDRVGVDDDFFDLGGDSMAATAICAEIERLAEKSVGPSMLLDAPTIASFAALLDSDLFEEQSRILVPSRTGGDRAPLVIVHGLDGNVFFSRRVSWMLPADQPVYGVQARGLDGRSPPHDSVDAMSSTYAEEIHKALGSRPIVLAGFCMGGVIAIEVLRKLMEMGGQVLRLVMIDPPPRPLDRRLDADELGRDQFETFRGQKIVKRVEALTVSRPDIAAHYSPGGVGYESALRVTQTLMRAYAQFTPKWTRFPTTILWSVDRATQVPGGPSKYPLVRGPAAAFVVRHRRANITHQMLMTEGVEPVAKLLNDIVVRAMDVAAAKAAQSKPAAAE